MALNYPELLKNDLECNMDYDDYVDEEVRQLKEDMDVLDSID